MSRQDKEGVEAPIELCVFLGRGRVHDDIVKVESVGNAGVRLTRPALTPLEDGLLHVGGRVHGVSDLQMTGLSLAEERYENAKKRKMKVKGGQHLPASSPQHSWKPSSRCHHRQWHQMI